MKKLIKQLQTEIDAAFLYRKLAEHYTDQMLAQIFTKLANIEEKHAAKVLARIQLQKPNFKQPGPSLRARIQIGIANIYGYEFVIANLAAVEWKITQAILQKKRATNQKITGFENLHLNILKDISQHKSFNIEGDLFSKFEGKHKVVSGNELRAGVLGANDGLVSNMSLVMGVAGATQGQAGILVAGIAGLLAGSISMALGEWLSVQCARELYQKQIDIEAQELENDPEEEINELAILYEAKGIAPERAHQLAQTALANPETALDTLVKEELGIDKDALAGSAWKAAITSFFLFAFGAAIPVMPFIFFTGSLAIYSSLIFSTIALFMIGAIITLFTGKNFLISGFRQVIFGLAASGITYLIGRLIGGAIIS